MLPDHPSVPDLQIFVYEVDGDTKHLGFRATAADPHLGFGTFVDYGQIRLRVDPNRYLDGIFSQLQPAGSRIPASLEAAGVRLFGDLLPFELRRLLWLARSEIQSIFVVTAEAWIPWELLKLQDPEGNDIGPFFAETFALGRWLNGSAYRSSAAMNLPLQQIGLIFPVDSDLPHAQEEKQDLLAFATQSRQVVEIPARREAIADAMAEGTFDCWHFCGHGDKAEGPVEPWYLRLESEWFDPNQLHGRARSLGQRHPLVFLNACHGGRAGEGLTGHGGLPASFVQVGAGAFIGPLWAVSDRGAACFARAFYRAFLGGATLGASVLAARRELRSADEFDSTWLAYILLGHPSAICHSTADAHSSRESAGPAATRDVRRRKRVPVTPKVDLHRDAPGNSPRPGFSSRTKIGVVVLVLASILTGSANWRIPTRVRLEGRASRISAHLGPEGASLLGDGLEFAKLTVAGLGAAEVSSRASEANIKVVKLETEGILFVSPTKGAPQGQATLGRLSLVESQRVLWEAERWPNSVSLRLEGVVAEPPYEIVLPNAFGLRSAQKPVAIFERNGPSVLRLFPAVDGLVLDAELLPGSPSEPYRRLLDKATELKALSFTQQRTGDGTLRSTVIELAISYPDALGLSETNLASDGVVLVDPADSYLATLLELDPARGEIVFVLEGRARKLLAGTVGNLRDIRLSVFQIFLKEILLVLVLSAISVGVWWRVLLGWVLMTNTKE